MIPNLTTQKDTACSNCNTEVTGKFCAGCGQPTTLKRIDSHYISHELQHLLHVEKGFLYTILQMLQRPGYLVMEYLNHTRAKAMKPIPFLIFASLLYTLVNNYLHVEERFVNFNDGRFTMPGGRKSTVVLLLQWVQGHYGYANIIMGVFTAMFVKLFYRKHHYNIFEITTLLCFIMGEGMFLMMVFGIVAVVTKSKIIFSLASIALLLYSTWAIGQFYQTKKLSGYFKALFVYLGGSVLFYVVLVLIGVLIDRIMK